MSLRSVPRVLVAIALFPALLSAQAEALPEPLPITESRNAAAGYAITRDVSMNVLHQRCAALGNGLEGRFAKAYADWQKANGPALDAAYFWTQFVGSMVSAQSGDEAGRRFIADTGRTLETQGVQAVAILFDGKDVDAARCETLLPLFAHPDFAADAHAEFKPLLAEIAALQAQLRRAAAAGEG